MDAGFLFGLLLEVWLDSWWTFGLPFAAFGVLFVSVMWLADVGAHPGWVLFTPVLMVVGAVLWPLLAGVVLVVWLQLRQEVPGSGVVWDSGRV